jgi:hypothetical protein
MSFVGAFEIGHCMIRVVSTKASFLKVKTNNTHIQLLANAMCSRYGNAMGVPCAINPWTVVWPLQTIETRSFISNSSKKSNISQIQYKITCQIRDGGS